MGRKGTEASRNPTYKQRGEWVELLFMTHAAERRVFFGALGPTPATTFPSNTTDASCASGQMHRPLDGVGILLPPPFRPSACLLLCAD